MAQKIFTDKQREIIARKLGYDGPMSEFDKFVRSDPAMEQKVRQLAVKLVANGGFIKKYAAGGLTLNVGNLNAIDAMYENILGRQADPGGKQYYESQLASGRSLADIQKEVSASPEGKAVAATREAQAKAATVRLPEAPSLPAPVSSPPPAAYTPPPPVAPVQKVEKIGSAKADQLLTKPEDITAETVKASTAGEAEVATAPTAATAPTIEAVKAKEAVDTVIAGNNAIQGTLSSEALATAAEVKPEETALKDLEAAKLANPQEVVGVPERTLQAGELVSGPSVNMATVDATLNKAEAATAALKPEMTVSGQLDKLLADFDAQNPPIWAASSMRNATSVLISRGMGASSLAGQAVIQATLEAALPIAVQDAQTIATLELQNLSNRQQMAVLTATQRATFLGQEFDQAFQTKVLNAAKIADIANINFTAEQTIALENAKLAQTVDLANLSNEQALVMARAAQIANLESANLDNRQKAALQNAQAFLQLDLTNLNNEQQTALFNAEKSIQAIFTDAAAQNAAKQFNAASEMQVQQFYDSLSAQVSQFNAAQKNSMTQFNVNQENAVAQFNAAQTNSMEQFNQQNRLIVDQSNAEWRRQIALVDTGAINSANQFDATSSLQTTLAQYNNMWQSMRDQMEYSFKTSEGALDRQNTLAIATLQKQASIEAAKFQLEAAKYEALGKLSASVFSGSGADIISSVAGGASKIVDFLTGFGKDDFGTGSISADIISDLGIKEGDLYGDLGIDETDIDSGQGGFDYLGNPIKDYTAADIGDAYWGGSDQLYYTHLIGLHNEQIR